MTGSFVTFHVAVALLSAAKSMSTMDWPGRRNKCWDGVRTCECHKRCVRGIQHSAGMVRCGDTLGEHGERGARDAVAGTAGQRPSAHAAFFSAPSVRGFPREEKGSPLPCLFLTQKGAGRAALCVPVSLFAGAATARERMVDTENILAVERKERVGGGVVCDNQWLCVDEIRDGTFTKQSDSLFFHS